MKEDDFWDWEQLYYLGTVTLNMNEKTFWKITPRKLFALLDVHIEMNSSAEDRAKNGVTTKREKNNPKNNKEVIGNIASW